MAPRQWFREYSKQYSIYSIVCLIALLLVGNIYLIYENSLRIEHNKNVYEKAERIKVNTVEIIRNLHLLDMAIRSYALIRQEEYLTIAESCFYNKDTIFSNIEKALTGQGYAMENFYSMKDSVNQYYGIVAQMRDRLLDDELSEFLHILAPDPGLKAWNAFLRFSIHVNAFEERISEKAQQEYHLALRNSYWLQIILFLIAIPTLAYTAVNTTRSLRLSEQLTRSTEENYKILADQNVMLEQKVLERTQELAAHNDRLVRQQREIQLQGNELREQNEELQNAKKIIELQNKHIQLRHDELAREVDRQTQNLKQANFELIEHNDRLEQFAYIISHNLRAPMARLNGLASILKHARSAEESTGIIQMMVKSTGELDQVIRDLGMILGIRKPGSLPVQKVDLCSSLDKVAAMLECEMAESGAILRRDLEVGSLYSLSPYIDSILYNLVSNALKYRHPDRAPEVTVSSKMEDGLIRITIADNGLGIDLASSKDSLFNLYKRFHFHVEGKGLGLYLVKSQIMALGGKIEVESKVDEGSAFTLFFNQQPVSYADN